MERAAVNYLRRLLLLLSPHSSLGTALTILQLPLSPLFLPLPTSPFFHPEAGMDQSHLYLSATNSSRLPAGGKQGKVDDAQTHIVQVNLTFEPRHLPQGAKSGRNPLRLLSSTFN